jgi:hypothetical protein
MKSEDRRSLVRLLSDEDYMDVMAVCSSFPHISITTETQGTCIYTNYNTLCLDNDVIVM